MKTLQQAIKENLEKVLAGSNAITSPECLKNCIMRSQICEHWVKQIRPLAQMSHYSNTDLLCMCQTAFDNAVDELYALTA